VSLREASDRDHARLRVEADRGGPGRRAGAGAAADRRCGRRTGIRGYTARIADRRVSEFSRFLACTGRGQAHLETGRPARALADLDRALEIDPAADYQVYSLRGLALFALGRCAEAAEDFDAGCGTRDDDGGLAPRLWGHIARLRAGKDHGDVLGSYLESRLAEAVDRPVRPRSWRGGCRVIIWHRSGSSRRNVAFLPDAERKLAELFLGCGSPDEYFEVVQRIIDAVPPPLDPDDPELRKEHRDKVQRLSAGRALHLGEYYLLKGRKKLAEKWLARAADFSGRPDERWPLVGAGSLARYELKRLRGEGR